MYASILGTSLSIAIETSYPYCRSGRLSTFSSTVYTIYNSPYRYIIVTLWAVLYTLYTTLLTGTSLSTLSSTVYTIYNSPYRYIIVHCHRDILSLLQEWPFVHFEQYLYCTHCMLRREEEPYMYPAEILQHCCPQRVYRLQCCPKEPEAYIPACLVYPLDTGKLNSMSTAGLQTTPKEPEAYIPACLVYPLDTGKLNSMSTAGLQTTVLSKGTWGLYSSMSCVSTGYR